MEIIRKCERYFTPIGRIMLGAFFLLAGISKIMDVGGTAGYIESVGFPMAGTLAILAIIVEVGAGGALMIGYQARWAAIVLAVFTFIISFPFHGPSTWAADPMQQIMFMKNMIMSDMADLGAL